MIHDQRLMLRARTVEQVRARWRETLARHNVEVREAAGLPLLSLTDDNRSVAAYVNHGRWVADCPNCAGGIACWAENPHGCCLDCFHVYRVLFPDDRHEVEAALEARPVKNRNWRPGETVDQLHTEALLLGGLLREIG